MPLIAFRTASAYTGGRASVALAGPKRGNKATAFVELRESRFRNDLAFCFLAGVESGSTGRCTGNKALKILNRTALGGITADILANGSDFGDGRGIVVDGLLEMILSD